MATVPAFASAIDAVDMVRAGLRFLAAADATRLTAAERAACLRGLEKADAAATAARTSMLAGSGAGQDYADDGDYSLFSWLRHRTQHHPRHRRGPHRVGQAGRGAPGGPGRAG